MAKRGTRISRIDAATAAKMFSNVKFPTGYLPATGVAHFLNPNGVPLRDVLSARQDLLDENTRSDVQRDFAADMTMWTTCTLKDYFAALSPGGPLQSRSRALKRVTNRERLCSLEEVCALWDLQLPSDVPMSGMSAPPKVTSTAVEVTGASYHHTSYAAVQEHALKPIRGCNSPDALVKFRSYPELRNCLYVDVDSCSPMKLLSLLCRDPLVYTQEFVYELARYLRRRLEQLGDDAIASRGADGVARYRPILSTFASGRLAWFLNESRMLPAQVIPLRLPSMMRTRRFKYQPPEGYVSPSFAMEFPLQVADINHALETHRPALVIVEPHVDRDYTSELRGFHTVREVVMLGQVDSPAMCSFTFPLLSFGVLPGPSTYNIYNDALAITQNRQSGKMPMDPPFVAQGYTRVFVDDISKVMLHPNDSKGLQNQSRCLTFRRVVIPPARH